MAREDYISIGPSPVGPAGGDLSGGYPNPTVDGLQGIPVSGSAPANGQVLTYSSAANEWYAANATGGGGGDPGAAYVVMSTTASLANDRALTAGTGILITDGGAGSTVTLGINNNVVATVSGTTFTGAILAGSGLSGSLQKTTSGLSYLVAGSNITVTSGTNGQVVVAGTVNSFVPSTLTGSWDTSIAGVLKTTGSVSHDSSNRTPSTASGTDTYFWVSGSKGVASASSNAHVSVFGGDVFVSGSISGSIQQVSPGLSYLVAVGGISITSQSNGQILISGSSISGGSGASTFSGEGVWNGGTSGVLITTGSVSHDSGNNAPSHFGTDNWFFVSGSIGVASASSNAKVSVFGGDVLVSGSITGSIQQVKPGLSYLVGSPSITVTSASNGQVTFVGTVTQFAPSTLTGSWDTLVAGTLKSTGTVSIDGGNRSPSTASGTDAFLWVSGSIGVQPSSTNRHVAVFGGDVVISGTLTGSLTKTIGGLSYIVAGSNMTVTSASNGQITLAAATGGGSSFSGEGVWVGSTNGVLISTGSVSIDGTDNAPSHYGADNWFYVSGSTLANSNANSYVSVFGGDVVTSGTLSLGPFQASTGTLRLRQDFTMYARNANTALPDVQVMAGTNGGNNVLNVGADSWAEVYFGNLSVGITELAGQAILINANGVPSYFESTGISFEVPLTLGALSSGGTDNYLYVSGSVGVLSGSDRSVSVLCDTVVSGNIRQVGQGENGRNPVKWQHFSSSQTTSNTKLQAFQWQPPADTATSVNLFATANSAGIGNDAAATFNLTALLRNRNGTLTQEGPVGGFPPPPNVGSNAIIATSGTLWGVSIDVSTPIARLWLTGSTSTNVDWGWELMVMEVTGTKNQ
jgi:hypothetical protein